MCPQRYIIILIFSLLFWKKMKMYAKILGYDAYTA